MYIVYFKLIRKPHNVQCFLRCQKSASKECYFDELGYNGNVTYDIYGITTYSPEVSNVSIMGSWNITYGLHITGNRGMDIFPNSMKDLHGKTLRVATIAVSKLSMSKQCAFRPWMTLASL